MDGSVSVEWATLAFVTSAAPGLALGINGKEASVSVGTYSAFAHQRAVLALGPDERFP